MQRRDFTKRGGQAVRALSYEGQRVLVLAPHADDETIGCGGVIQKYIRHGSPVRVLIASVVVSESQKYFKDMSQYKTYSGIHRLAEMRRAFEILGITDFHFMYLDDAPPIRHHSRLDTVPRVEMVTMVEDHIHDFSPTVLFIPSRTKHQDHEVMHNVALTSARPYFWQGSIFIYETDGEMEFQPNLIVPLTADEVSIKADALDAFGTQLGPERHPLNPQTIVTRARYRGQLIYADYAEAFQVLRLHG